MENASMITLVHFGGADVSFKLLIDRSSREESGDWWIVDQSWQLQRV